MEQTQPKKKYKKKRRPRCLIFDMVALPPHPSTRPEDNGALFRRIFIEVKRPFDKRLMIQIMFNGPSDPAFHSLVGQFAHSAATADAQLAAHTPQEAAAIKAASLKAAAEAEAAASSTTDSEAESETDSEAESETDSEAESETDSGEDTSCNNNAK
ncbi:clumping factor B-like [Drosophila sulfurigaster albostrigata]|uniref:clumping factor B-like n=1 Tax=Drosophila sulfurigaster albostrigata TaxID=89887 RepID=UPI002D21DCB5|nr:clumping factor B-like [Drosophila sulfurigaster albostrigata]